MGDDSSLRQGKIPPLDPFRHRYTLSFTFPLEIPGPSPMVSRFIFALIVYRLGQEILILQSGVRFPVRAPATEESVPAQTGRKQIFP